MASSSIGSDVFALLSLLVIAAFVILLLRYYLPIRTTPGYLLLPVFLALALPLSIILLVPIDLASYGSRSRAIWLPERLTLICWRISYWLTFILTWLLLPLLGEYVDSGFREPKDRFVYSLRSNARYQLITIGITAIALVYFVMENGFQGQSIKSLVMALAYAWGLILAIFLMGHGLVAIPRQLLYGASLGRSLKEHQSHAVGIHDKMTAAAEDLSALEVQLLQLQRQKGAMSADMRDWIDDLADTAPTIAGRTHAQQQLSSAPSQVPPIVTARYLAELSRKLKRARHKHARFTGEWQHLDVKVTYLQQVIDASASKHLVLSSSDDKTLFTMPLLNPRARFHLHAHVLPTVRLTLGIFLSLLSTTLIWSEIAHTITPRISIMNLTVITHPTSNPTISLSGQLVASIWLCYMCTSALYSLSRLKIWGNRALVKRTTYAESATWYSLQVAKLTVPLAYNFITMLDPVIYKQTSFFAFFGRYVNLTPLGQGFSSFFPIFILVPVCASLFGLYGRVRRLVGFDILESSEDQSASWRGGAMLLARDTQARPQLGVGVQQYTDLPSPVVAGHRGQTRVGTVAQVGAEDNDDDTARYFFQDLGERVRNTFETTDRPGWLRELGDSLKRPAWMTDGRAGGGGGIGRMFGGGRGGTGTANGNGNGNARFGGIRL